jgi:hypothetical protein
VKSPKRQKDSARPTGDASVSTQLDRDLAALRLLLTQLGAPKHVVERIDRVRSGRSPAEKLYVLDWANDWAKWAKKAKANSTDTIAPKSVTTSVSVGSPTSSKLARKPAPLTLEAQNRRARAFLDERARRTHQQTRYALQAYLARKKTSNSKSRGKSRCRVCGRIALDWENHCSDDER